MFYSYSYLNFLHHWRNNNTILHDAWVQVLKTEPDFKRKPWPNISDSAKDFVKKLLVKDPRTRLTAAQALCMFKLDLSGYIDHWLYASDSQWGNHCYCSVFFRVFALACCQDLDRKWYSSSLLILFLLPHCGFQSDSISFCSSTSMGKRRGKCTWDSFGHLRLIKHAPVC